MIIAEATNRGLGAIAASCSVPYDVLAWTAEWYFRGETLEAANAAIVNYHHRLPMTRAFGTGTLSSSDGQRFPVKGESLTARHLSRSPARPCTGPSSEPRLQTRPGNQPEPLPCSPGTPHPNCRPGPPADHRYLAVILNVVFALDWCREPWTLTATRQRSACARPPTGRTGPSWPPASHGCGRSSTASPRWTSSPEPGGDQMILTAATPANPRAGVLAVTEGGRHMLTVAGIRGDYPPTDPAGFDEFAAGLPSADIAAAIAGAEPLDDPAPFRFPASVRRRYERLAAFPAGLLVIGDAVCSFNPVYGQGMTVAATEAMTLRGLLARDAVPGPRRYFRAVAAAIDVAWDIAVGADLAFPQVPGKRSAKVRLVNAYMPRLHAAAAHDEALAASLVRVIGLKDRPEGLFRPDRVLRVLRGNLVNGRRPAPATAAPAPAAT